jgi:hypothetical protein
MRGKPQETPPLEPVSAEPSPVEPPPVVMPSARSTRWAVPAVLAAFVVVAGAVAATPYWAPAVMQALPWGNPPPKPAPAPAPAPAAHDEALAARVAALEAAQAKSDQSAAAAQSLGQRIAALEARPGPDLTPLQNQLTALTSSVADLTQKIAALDKAAQAAPADGTALALVLLQIREAVDIGRPFDAEYQAVVALSRAHPDIAAAAAPLAEPAKSGVASRAVLTARLHQLAPQIAEAATPAKSSWRSQIVARLRSLVTIRRIDGAGQSPAEAAVSNAERALAGGDLNAAIDALSGLGAANLAAAQPWLGMARQRLAVETALRQIETLVAAELGGAPAAPAKSG